MMHPLAASGPGGIGAGLRAGGSLAPPDNEDIKPVSAALQYIMEAERSRRAEANGSQCIRELRPRRPTTGRRLQAIEEQS